MEATLSQTPSSAPPKVEPIRPAPAVLAAAEQRRVVLYDQLDAAERSNMGQFGTPEAVSTLMASMFTIKRPQLRLIDAGAGVGSLTAAFVEHACATASCNKLHVTAFEVDPVLVSGLKQTLDDCKAHCAAHGIEFSHEVVGEDFIEYAVRAETDIFARPSNLRFDCAIQNPPYRKVRSDSTHRHLLRAVGIEASNLYAAFVALTIRLLEPDGELVAITPRSFCNGPYFKEFRAMFLERMALNRLHVFESRKKAFGGDGVLQENVITYATVKAGQPKEVEISTSTGATGADVQRRRVSYAKVVPKSSCVPFIHLVSDDEAEMVVDRMNACAEATLAEVGVQASTGRVVDFRARNLLRDQPGPDTVPLIYPVHLRAGTTRWPVTHGKKPNAIAREAEQHHLLVPPGRYVLIKRFSSKEQRRRVEAAIYDSEAVCPGAPVGFENHLNYLHTQGEGLDQNLAVGLAVYLNSTLLDQYFRLFSGHTQVNATDLRVLPFPRRDLLIQLGDAAGSAEIDQATVDDLVEAHVMAEGGRDAD